MQLQIAIPKQIVLDEAVRKVTVETDAGEICLLERRLDMVAGLKPGILIYEPVDGAAGAMYVALDGGTLVKCGERVMISSPNAMTARDLDEIEKNLDAFLTARRERDETGRRTMEKMQADFVRRFIESEHYG